MLPLGVVEREVFLEPKDGFGHRGRMLLVSLREAGCTINSLRPLSPGSRGPAYKIAHPYCRGWDLWFKASGALAAVNKVALQAAWIKGKGARPGLV